MKNVIYNICERLRGYSNEEEDLEVTQVKKNYADEYLVVIRVANEEPKEETADESNE